MNKRFRRRREGRDEKLAIVFEKAAESMGQHLSQTSCYRCSSIPILWDELPAWLDPGTGSLRDGDRQHRKRLQLQAVLDHVLPLLKETGTVVEFGAGTGHLGLVLAYLRPHCHIILVERKDWVADIAKKRLAELQLSTVTVFCGGIAEFEESELSHKMDLAVGLHCCGQLTDMSLQLSVRRGARFCIVPCCYGQVANGKPTKPQSKRFSDILDDNEFALLASAADFSVPACDEQFPTSSAFQVAKRCMTLMDADRCSLAEEAGGYSCSVGSLLPLHCSPKNNVIVGLPPGDPLNDAHSSDAPGVAVPQSPVAQVPHLPQGGTMPEAAPPPPPPAPSVDYLPRPSAPSTADQPLPSLPSFYNFDPNGHADEVCRKAEAAVGMLQPFWAPQVPPDQRRLAVHPSEPQHFRLRCCFQMLLGPKPGGAGGGGPPHSSAGAGPGAVGPVRVMAVSEQAIMDTSLSVIHTGDSCVEGRPPRGHMGTGSEPAESLGKAAMPLPTPSSITIEDPGPGSGGSSGRTQLWYAMWDKGGPAALMETFPVASRRISNDLMPRLLRLLRTHGDSRYREVLRDLRAVRFLSNLAGDDTLVTLVYGTAAGLGDQWKSEVAALRGELGGPGQKEGPSVVGRGRGIVRVLGRDYITERFPMDNGRLLSYRQVEGSFSNPNGGVNRQALHWLCALASRISEAVPGTDKAGGGVNLLELYCGNGNHTVALAPMFRNIVAVELDKRLCHLARLNLAENGVENAEVLQLHSERFCRSVLRSRRCKSEKTGQEYTFQAVLVDPPRAGLDTDTLALVRLYDHIIYISCNPDALSANLAGPTGLGFTHHLVQAALFDQFPYTKHSECAVYLRRKDGRV